MATHSLKRGKAPVESVVLEMSVEEARDLLRFLGTYHDPLTERGPVHRQLRLALNDVDSFPTLSDWERTISRYPWVYGGVA